MAKIKLHVRLRLSHLIHYSVDKILSEVNYCVFMRSGCFLSKDDGYVHIFVQMFVVLARRRV